MDNKKLKRHIIEMVEKIDNTDFLKHIYDYVHKYFIRGTGE